MYLKIFIFLLLFSNICCQKNNGKTKLITLGITGSGKSTLTNMLIEGDIDLDNKFKINNGLKGSTSDIKTYENFKYIVTDTIGFLEDENGTIKTEDAFNKTWNFLLNTLDSYNYYVYIIKAGRILKDEHKIFNFYKEIFAGCEDNFLLIISGGNNLWLEQNKEHLQNIYGNNINFLCLDFPLSNNLVYENIYKKYRKDDLIKLNLFLEKNVKKLCKPYIYQKYKTLNSEDYKDKLRLYLKGNTDPLILENKIEEIYREDIEKEKKVFKDNEWNNIFMVSTGIVVGVSSMYLIPYLPNLIQQDIISMLGPTIYDYSIDKIYLLMKFFKNDINNIFKSIMIQLPKTIIGKNIILNIKGYNFEISNKNLCKLINYILNNYKNELINKIYQNYKYKILYYCPNEKIL